MKDKRIHELTELLNEASRVYYTGNDEIMSNLEYDALYDELLALEEETGTVLPDSPTRRVGYKVVSTLNKVRHESKMLSLDKTKEINRLAEFLEEGSQETEGILSWKLDGLTCVITYSGGQLKQAVTRGNGEIGEDITHNAAVFKNLPKRIPFSNELILRGEAVISYADFERINESLSADERYKNPRNLCSGTVRQLNSAICAARNVSFLAFSLVKAEGMTESGDFSDLKSEQLAFLANQGFEVAYYERVNKDTVQGAVSAFYEKIQGNMYASDGLVLTYDSISYSRSLGATSKFPKDSIAFKWADETSETTLIGVLWNTSRTGLVNPVAVFEPVELEGTTVNRASLHNVSVLEGLRLGIGDTIRVYKANMIIPQVSENLTQSGTLEIPEHCPVCMGKTAIITANEAKSLYCMNPNCKAQRNRTLVHFTSRDAMNIEGFSVKTIEKFVEKGFLDNYSDIYRLHEHSDEISEMGGFGKRSLENLLSSIEQSKTRELHHFIYALGISQIGLSNAKLLCRHFSYDLDKIRTANTEELTGIDGFGEVIANSLTAYFADSRNITILSNALAYLDLQKPKDENDGKNKLSGKVFVITGDVHIFKNRAELQNEIEKNGGKVSAAVSGKTSYLINNDNLSQSSKNKKAGQLGIPVITEEMFLDLLREENL